MTSDEPTVLTVFEIGRGRDGWAVYADHIQEEVEPGTHVERMKELIDAGSIRADPLASERQRPRPERYLDIYESRKHGISVYGFFLNAEYAGEQRMLFAEKAYPFIALPINSSTNENFLTIDSYSQGNGRWASFSCNLGDVQGSKLADRIRALPPRDSALVHSRYLNIPFCFNVYDPVLGAAPWMVWAEARIRLLNEWTHGGVHPDLLQELAGVLDPSKMPGDIVTHGGVHPSAASFLSVKL